MRLTDAGAGGQAAEERTQRTLRSPSAAEADVLNCDVRVDTQSFY